MALQPLGLAIASVSTVMDSLKIESGWRQTARQQVRAIGLTAG